MADPRIFPAKSVEHLTFNVSEVPILDEMLAGVSYRRGIEFTVHRPLEACSEQTKSLVYSHGRALMGAVHHAFAHHYPLVLAPDHLWLLIVQGFARHVQENAEALRPRFVQHQDKMKLEVVSPEFKKGAPDNAWETVVAEFSRQIQAQLTGDFYDLLIARFSTTGALETAVFEIALMDTFQGYFDYGVTLCGIPSVTLEGNPADWRSILERARQLGAYNLEWWIEPLIPLLEELVHTSEGKINVEFWQSFYKAKSQSGGQAITGWLRKFFPYLRTHIETSDHHYAEKWIRNPDLFAPVAENTRFTPSIAGMGLSSAPFTWQCQEKTYTMAFIAGFVGSIQDPSPKALRPEIGWAICDVY